MYSGWERLSRSAIFLRQLPDGRAASTNCACYFVPMPGTGNSWQFHCGCGCQRQVVSILCLSSSTIWDGATSACKGRGFMRRRTSTGYIPGHALHESPCGVSVCSPIMRAFSPGGIRTDWCYRLIPGWPQWPQAKLGQNLLSTARAQPGCSRKRLTARYRSASIGMAPAAMAFALEQGFDVNVEGHPRQPAFVFRTVRDARFAR